MPVNITRRQLVRRKLFFPVGLLSLAFLPALCMWYLNNRNVFDDFRVIEIVWWSENMYKYSIYKPPYKIHPSRTFVDINLTGNDDEDKIKLDFAQLEIRELMSTQDTLTGVHFHFNSHAKYKAFIRALNILQTEKANVYVAKGSDIWVFNFRESQATSSESFDFCGTYRATKVLYLQSEQDKLNKLLATLKHYSIPAIPYIAMVYVLIKQIRQTDQSMKLYK